MGYIDAVQLADSLLKEKKTYISKYIKKKIHVNNLTVILQALAFPPPSHLLLTWLIKETHVYT